MKSLFLILITVLLYSIDGFSQDGLKAPVRPSESADVWSGLFVRGGLDAFVVPDFPSNTDNDQFRSLYVDVGFSFTFPSYPQLQLDVYSRVNQQQFDNSMGGRIDRGNYIIGGSMTWYPLLR